MSTTIEIIDPEGDRRARRRRRLFAGAVFAGVLLFGLPEARDYWPKWKALSAARKLGFYLSDLRTQAMLRKTPLEARFRSPDLVEVYEVSSCGPSAARNRLRVLRLSELELGVEFASEAWVREHTGWRAPVLARYCYDPAFGSSLLADGLVHGLVVLAHQDDVLGHRGDHAVQLAVEGPSGDLALE